MSVLNLVILNKGNNDPPRLTDMEHGYILLDSLIMGGKDFLSSIKDIENRFFKASECDKGYYMVPVAIFTIVFIKQSPHFSIER
ncbi:hypothetical protein MKX03_000041 [Papaver bracteatum]|nr:hypothetical protein MKX03_000041 [Papaver bracteatum]